MKRIGILLLLSALLSACAGLTVVYEGENDVAAPQSASQEKGAAPVRTGLYIAATSDSRSAQGADAGEAAFDVNMVAVTVDGAGVIQSCVIDGVSAGLSFDAEGKLTSDPYQELYSKNELGEAYSMKKYAGSRYEWNEQAAALAEYACGKTVEALRDGAVDANGYAADADLATMATISIGGYVDAIAEAVNHARDLGAQAGDALRLASEYELDGSTSAQAEENGRAVLSGEAVAITLRDGIITGCVVDGLQAEISFDASGTIAEDAGGTFQSKNALGEAYGMKKYAGSRYEWNEQAAAFSAYVTGKTPAQVQEIAIDEKTAPTEADLASSVTIAIGGFQALIARAAG